VSASEKAYYVDQALAGAWPGPLTAFNPLSNGWAVNTSLGWTGAWVRYYPVLRLVFMSAMMTVGTSTDGTQIATVPATDANNNPLRPSQIVTVNLATDQQRIATGSNNEGARLHLGSGGALTCFGVAAAATVAEVSGWYHLDPM
jgi:hypothetical protein